MHLCVPNRHLHAPSACSACNRFANEYSRSQVGGNCASFASSRAHKIVALFPFTPDGPISSTTRNNQTSPKPNIRRTHKPEYGRKQCQRLLSTIGGTNSCQRLLSIARVSDKSQRLVSLKSQRHESPARVNDSCQKIFLHQRLEGH